MPSPSANWTMVEVRGRYVGSDGQPLQGRVLFTPRAPRSVDAGDLVVAIRRDIIGYLDEDGAFSVQLPATDDPDISPTGFTYVVKEDFTGGANPYDIEVPEAAAGTGLEIATIAPDPSAVGIGVLTYARLLAAIEHAENLADYRYLNLLAARNPDSIVTGNIVLDANGVTLTADVTWPDGTPGVVTGVPDTTHLGMAKGWSITYGSPVTATYTQPTITFNSNGDVTAFPAIVVT